MKFNNSNAFIFFSFKRILKITTLFFLLSSFIFLSACENDITILSATISEITQGNSDSYTIKIVYEKDSRMDNKYIDVQVRCDVEDLVLNFNEEGNDVISLNLTTENRWHSLTSLISSANGVSGKEMFKKYKDANNIIYTFTCKEKAKVDFRVVAGDTVENDDLNGQILVNAEPISKIVSLKINKK